MRGSCIMQWHRLAIVIVFLFCFYLYILLHSSEQIWSESSMQLGDLIHLLQLSKFC